MKRKTALLGVFGVVVALGTLLWLFANPGSPNLEKSAQSPSNDVRDPAEGLPVGEDQFRLPRNTEEMPIGAITISQDSPFSGKIADLKEVMSRLNGSGAPLSDRERTQWMDRLKDMVAELAKGLDPSHDDLTRFEIADALRGIGQAFASEDSRVLAPAEDSLLAYLLSDVNYPEGSTAAIALSYIRPMSDRVVEAIVKQMESGRVSGDSGFVALAAGAAENELAEIIVLDALQDSSDPSRRFNASNGLRSFKGPYSAAAIDLLLENTLSEDPSARISALLFFETAVLRSAELATLSVPNLLENLRLPQHKDYKASAIIAAKNAYKVLGGVDALLDSIVTVALSPDESISARRTAIGAMTAIAPESRAVHNAIDELLQDPDPKVRDAAVKTSSRLR